LTILRRPKWLKEKTRNDSTKDIGAIGAAVSEKIRRRRAEVKNDKPEVWGGKSTRVD